MEKIPETLNFSLVVCTYKRHESLFKLLKSLENQTVYPNKILIIDGSPDAKTEDLLKKESFRNLEYFKVKPKNRGLTKQRNFGIERVATSSEVVCFLDDDIVLTPTYFQNLLNTYRKFPDALGVGGYIKNEIDWIKDKEVIKFDEFEYDGFSRKLASRHLLRKKLGLQPDVPPGYMPDFSNGYAIGFLPPTGKSYKVESFMGGVASYRKGIFDKINFSSYFEGYGLYEDMDFCLRASKLGQLYVNTSAQLYHHHNESGRPNQFKYGKMVLRNGWYVWRVKYPSPDLKSRIKWHATAFLLTLVRFSNVFTTSQRKKALTESLGRVAGWWSLLWNKPKSDK
ncbi:glycosyltransferase family 2 protein [Salegentibacter salegens]|uniref:Glycosyltransferase, GT2 family n=1 Tax=Salegentibacter salegens TaxID=143223 RepID=A0A1M7NF68_9FLAO|nr:glycosyltransferase [Salegentibacter salegens]PRX46288.1 GT2 family glycosyltransferase [Salegentibacter salegens]SHN02262.1 Glycosyltransferase, GT2 family [Salegentibacter salegens]